MEEKLSSSVGKVEMLRETRIDLLDGKRISQLSNPPPTLFTRLRYVVGVAHRYYGLSHKRMVRHPFRAKFVPIRKVVFLGTEPGNNPVFTGVLPGSVIFLFSLPTTDPYLIFYLWQISTVAAVVINIVRLAEICAGAYQNYRSKEAVAEKKT